MCSKAKDLWLTQSVWNSTWESAVVIKRQGLMTLRNSTFNLPPSGVRSRRVNRSKAPEQDFRLCQLVVAHGGSLLVCVFYYRPHHLLFQDVLPNLMLIFSGTSKRLLALSRQTRMAFCSRPLSKILPGVSKSGVRAKTALWSLAWEHDMKYEHEWHGVPKRRGEF